MRRKALRLIGYWSGPHAGVGWPDVGDFVDPSAAAEDQRSLAEFLRSGTTVLAAAGFSQCRLCGMANGSTELTDGEHFVWPQGLVHYVEAHDVRLPQDVVDVAARGRAQPLDGLRLERALLSGGLVVDARWWRALRPPAA